MSFQGGCLCGAVRYQGEAEQGGGHCHCIDCRKSSGTGHCSHMVAPDTEFRVIGNLTFYASRADSGNIVNRGFCPTCGSPVYSTNSGMPGMVFIRASTLDDPEVFQPQMVVYTRSAISWNPVQQDLPSFETMPPMDQMPPELI
jgi:hypothetical protein